MSYSPWGLKELDTTECTHKWWKAFDLKEQFSEMWFPNQQHQGHLGTCQKCQLTGYVPELCQKGCDSSVAWVSSLKKFFHKKGAKWWVPEDLLRSIWLLTIRYKKAP